MRNETTIFMLSYMLLVLMSCKNDDATAFQSNSDDADSEINFVADIEGIPLNADNVTVSEISVLGSMVVSISARNTSTNQLLIIQFPSNLEAGSYQYDLMPSETLAFGSYQPDTSNSTVFTSTSGVITIIDNDVDGGFVEGTTFFTAIDTSTGSVIEVTFCEFALQF